VNHLILTSIFIVWSKKWDLLPR